MKNLTSMDRRKFIKHGTFTVAALGLAPWDVMSTTSAQGSFLSIEQMSHIRHGLLTQVNPAIFATRPVVFQSNHFSQGIAMASQADQLQVLSVLHRESERVRAHQLSLEGDTLYLVSDEQAQSIQLALTGWQNLMANQNISIEAYTGQNIGKLQLRNDDLHECHLLMLRGKALVGGSEITENRGHTTHSTVVEIDIIENRSVLLLVKHKNTSYGKR